MTTVRQKREGKVDEGRVFGGHNVRAPRRELLSRKGADRPCRRRPPGQLLHHFVVLSEATADAARSECDLTKRTTDLDRLAAVAAERVSRFSLSTAFRNDDAKLGRSVGLLMKSCAGCRE